MPQAIVDPEELRRFARNLKKFNTSVQEQAGALVMQRANSPDPAAEVERNEERRRVRQVLAQMKPRAARVLALRHSGLSYAEVAAALNVASSSVGTLLARAEKEFERRYRALEESNEAP